MRLRFPVALAVGGMLMLAPAGCGGDDDAPADSPAALAPADSVLYVEGVVRPEGDQRAAVEDLLGRFPEGAQLDETLIEQLDEGIAEEADVEGESFTYADDIEPWLGERAAVFSTELSEDTEAVAILEVTDEDAAQDAIEQAGAIDTKEEEEETYGGVTYTIDDEDGSGAGLVDGWFVAGNEEGIRDAIDASAGETESLAESGELDDTALEADPLAFARIDLAALAVAFPGGTPTAPTGTGARPEGRSVLTSTPVQEAAPPQVEGTLEVALFVEGDSVRLDAGADLPEELAGQLGAAGNPEEALDVLRDLPAESFAAGAFPRFGPQIARGIEQGIEQQFGPGANPRFFRDQLRQQLGFDPLELAGALGDLGFYAQPTGPGRAGGGIVVDVTDQAVVDDAIRGLEAVLRLRPELRVLLPNLRVGDGFIVSSSDLPAGIAVLSDGERLAAAYDLAAALDGLNPKRTLAESDLIDRAEAALGDDLIPSLLVDFPPLVEVLTASSAADDPDFDEALPYLEQIDLVAAGSEVGEDGRFLTRFVITVAE